MAFNLIDGLRGRRLIELPAGCMQDAYRTSVKMLPSRAERARAGTAGLRRGLRNHSRGPEGLEISQEDGNDRTREEAATKNAAGEERKPAESDRASTTKGRKSNWKVVGLLAAMLFVGYWTYVFLPGSRPENPDLLNEPAFLVQAERMCAATAKLVSELPGAAAAAGPEERAAQIRATNDLWQQLVNELSDLAARSSAARNREIVNGWISDWRIYLSDRVSYAETLAEGEDPPFTVTSRRGRGVTEYMTAFAETNGMSSCGTPDDV